MFSAFVAFHDHLDGATGFVECEAIGVAELLMSVGLVEFDLGGRGYGRDAIRDGVLLSIG